MRPERNQYIDDLFHSALGRVPSTRAAFLNEVCAGDEELRREVTSLLAAYEQAGDLLEQPVAGAAAHLLADQQTRSLIGQQIGHYRITALLGAGGMGEVYLAEDTSLGRRTAIKLLPALFTTDREKVRRFQREARAVSALNHPNILTIYEIGEFDSAHFIATEFIDGVTLRKHMTDTVMRITETLDVAAQAASALAAAHEEGIVHRDIKPENIMLRRRDGIVKVLDFGLAKLIERKAPITDLEAATIQKLTTHPGVVMGTVSYMSPEQARGLEVDARSDIWSLGCVLFEMVTGRLPFEGATLSDVISSILEKEPPPVARYSRETPEALEWIITKALRKDREERYQTAKELLTDLHRLKQRLEFEAEMERSSPPELSGSTAAAINSLAVLPLTNVSADPDVEYLSDGITESIINSLSHLPHLRVMARSTVFRFKGRDVEPQEVGRELGVQAVLTGRLLQRGDTLIIGTELVDVADGALLWGEQYNKNLSDILALQGEISKEITEKLRLRLTVEEKKRLSKRHTDNAEAYQLYLRGRYSWNMRTEEGFKKGLEYFQQAVGIDPNYALGYAGLADCYVLLGTYDVLPIIETMPKAKAAALKALEIDDTLAEAHASLATIKFEYDWDFAAARREYRRAIELNPNYATARHWYANYLSATGRHDEAIAEIKRARELDPLSLIISANLGTRFYYARQYDRAIEQSRKTLEMAPDFYVTHATLGLAYEQTGAYEDAIAEFQKMIALAGEDPELTALLGHAYAVSGRRDQALGVLGELQELSEQRYVSSFYMALIYTGLGDRDQAFVWLEKAYQERSVVLLLLGVDPKFDGLRSDPRFAELSRRVGLPQAATHAALEFEVEMERSSPPGMRSGKAAVESGKERAAITGVVGAARSTSSVEYIVGEITSHQRGAILALTFLVIVVAGIAFGIYKFAGQTKPAAAPFQTIKMTRLTATGKAKDAAISLDGKYVVYVEEDAKRQSLWVKQVATGSSVQIVPPAEVSYWGLTFSNDSNYVYYAIAKKNKFRPQQAAGY